MMKSSYAKEDVCLLLKDVTGLVAPLPAKEREILIQNGAHYCEMLPVEYVPGKAYMEAYKNALESYSGAVARAVEVLGEKILAWKGIDVVLVSLARAGTPIGILLKHYLQKKYGMKISHYSVSIIRGKGIDQNAMRYLLARYRPEQLQFVDGWIGIGAILSELRSALSAWPGVSPELGVVADPAYATWLCGTHEDILIPSSCLNCTVSGLISRTFLREDIIGEQDFHGAVYYEELKGQDLSYAFLQAIEAEFTKGGTGRGSRNQKSDRVSGWQKEEKEKEGSGRFETNRIAQAFGVNNINFIKPGIGETTRVLLRRIPWKVLVDPRYIMDSSIAHILRLARDKGVPVEEYRMTNYKACGIIQVLADT